MNNHLPYPEEPKDTHEFSSVEISEQSQHRNLTQRQPQTIGATILAKELHTDSTDEEKPFMRVRYEVKYLVPRWLRGPYLENIFSRNPLSYAITRGDLDGISKLLLNPGLDVNALDGEFMTPLERACRHQHPQTEAIIKMLIEHGADINGSQGRESLLSRPVERGDIHMVNFLLSNGVDVNAHSTSDRAPLLMACENGHVDIVRILINKSADANTHTANGMSPLLMACKNGHVDVARILIRARADVNDCPAAKYDMCPLSAACRNGHVNIIKLLLDAGADVNGPGNLSFVHRPLQAACSLAQIEAIKLLLQAGVKIDSNDGLLALANACTSEDIETVKLLINAGVKINKEALGLLRSHHISLLSSAAGGQRLIQFTSDFERPEGEQKLTIDLLRYLIECGVDPCEDGSELPLTALQAAAIRGDTFVVDELIKLSADVNQQSRDGSTALQLASPNLKVMEILLGHGADVDTGTGACGFTALQKAAYFKHETAVQHLVNNFRASVNAPARLLSTLEAAIANPGGKVNEELKEKIARIVTFLLENSADCTPECLFFAICNGATGVVNILLEHKNFDEDVMTHALEVAVLEGQVHFVTLLIELSVRPSAVSAHVAARKGDTDMLGLLLAHGAASDGPPWNVPINPWIPLWRLSKCGDTLIDTAIQNGKLRAAAVLKEWDRNNRGKQKAVSRESIDDDIEETVWTPAAEELRQTEESEIQYHEMRAMVTMRIEPSDADCYSVAHCAHSAEELQFQTRRNVEFQL